MKENNQITKFCNLNLFSNKNNNGQDCENTNEGRGSKDQQPNESSKNNYYKKCLTLLDHFKQEQNNDNSPLLTQAAREIETFYKKLTD